MLSIIGVEKAILLDASTYLISLILLLFIKYSDEDKVLEKSIPNLEGFKNGLKRHKVELKEGLIYLKSNVNVLFIISNLVFFHFLVVALFASTIIDYSIRVFEIVKPILFNLGFDTENMLVGSHTTFVFLFVAVGAMFTPVIKSVLNKFRESVLSVWVFLFGACLMFLAAFLSFILSVESFYIIFLGIVLLVGIVAGLQYIRYSYLIQLNTDKEFMGRVTAIAEIVWSLALFIGILSGSLFNDYFSYKFGFILTGVICCFGAISFYFSRGKIDW